MTISALRYLCVAALLPIAASRVAPAADARDSLLPQMSTSSAVFEQNVGQFSADVRFAVLGAGRPSVAITARGGLQIGVAGTGAKAGVSARLDMVPVDGSPTPTIAATEQLPAKVHRFVGSDPSEWRRNISTAARVRVSQLYDGIDLEYYGTDRDIEYDFIVAPGADPGVIGLRVAGADVRRDESGGLILATPGGDVHQRRPIAYQDVAGGRRDVPVEYRVSDSVVTFDVGDYDRARPLVIDPILVVSTFLGGPRNDSGRAVTFGTDGLFVAGTADRGTLSGPSQVDTFVAKYSIDGRTLQFITYYGGTQAPLNYSIDSPSGIAVDQQGVIYVAGNTTSLNLPIVGSAVQTVLMGPGGGFLFRLSEDGASLLLSTYIGSGNYPQSNVVADLALETDLYLVGSGDLGSIPIAPGPGSGWILRLTLDGAPLAARRVGGEPAALAVASNGAVIVAGNGGGWATPGAFQTTPGQSVCPAGFRQSRGCTDGNVARFSPDFATLEWATFLRETSFQPNSAEDLIFDIAVDRSGAVYVTGRTLSTSFPVTPGAYQSTCGFCDVSQFFGLGGTAFVTKLNATGSAVMFSTFLGGSGGSTGWGLAVDPSGAVFVTGEAISPDFPAAGPPLPSQAAGQGFGDAFITLLNPTGTAALYSSRFGGSSLDVGRGLALSRFGTVAVTGDTQSSDFPTVDAVQPGHGSQYDAFVSIVSAPRIVTVLESPADGGTTRATSTTLRGFAADTRAVGSTGIDGIHIYAYPNGAGPPIFLGLATAGEQRDDVAAALGDDFATSGFSLTTTLTPGEYLFVAYAHSDVTGAFGDPAIVRARAEAGAQLNLESPAPGPSNQSFVVSGTAVDLDAPSGTGIDTVHVWAYPNPGSGAPARFLGVADYGEPRPDLEIAYGARFRNAGFSLDTTLEPGSWLLVAYGHSTVSQTFSVHETAAITVRAGQAEVHFEAPLGPVVYSAFEINGWARDAGAVTGAGFDAIHVWAYPNPGSGAAPVFLGATTAALGRPDIANTHGLQFLLSGFVIRTAPLTAGNYLVVVFARSTVTNRFDVHESRMLEVREATEAVLQVNAPANGAVVGATVGVTGHAFDPRSVGHLGVDGVHVWLYPNWGSGQAPIFVGLAFQGLDSPDVGASYGLNFSKAGFQLPVHIPPGSGASHLIAVFAHSNVTGAFTMKTVLVTRQ